MRTRIAIAVAGAAMMVGILAAPAAGYGTPKTLTVSKQGTAAGVVRSRPIGIDCGADCSQSYTTGTVVHLRAAPAAGAVFAGWGGSCSGTGTCSVTMDASKSVSATFNTA